MTADNDCELSERAAWPAAAGDIDAAAAAAADAAA